MELSPGTALLNNMQQLEITSQFEKCCQRGVQPIEHPKSNYTNDASDSFTAIYNLIYHIPLILIPMVKVCLFANNLASSMIVQLDKGQYIILKHFVP